MYVVALYACTWSSGSVLCAQLAAPCIQLTASDPGTGPASGALGPAASATGAPASVLGPAELAVPLLGSRPPTLLAGSPSAAGAAVGVLVLLFGAAMSDSGELELGATSALGTAVWLPQARHRATANARSRITWLLAQAHRCGKEQYTPVCTALGRAENVEFAPNLLRASDASQK
jgi:hypothetical protein